MDSLDHLKTHYRPRYLNRDGQRQAFDGQGENVLKYIQGCFETCAKEFKIHSPVILSESSSSSNQDQDQILSQSKDKEQPECDKIKHVEDVNSAFNTFTALPSQDREDTCSDDDIDMISLGSPALLMEGKLCEGIVQSEDEVCEMDLKNSIDAGESERYHSSKEVKEVSVEEAECSATSSSKKQISESLVSVEAIMCSFTERNTAKKSNNLSFLTRNASNVEPEDECDFLIEESFGMPSTSWISSSKKSPKPRKDSSKTVTSQQKKGTRQHGVKSKSKRESQKPITPTPINQTEIKSTNVSERTDGLQNVSGTNETMSTVGEKSRLWRQQELSKDDTSVEINNRDSQVGSLTEDHASLKQNNSFLQPIISASCSSIRKRTVKQTNSKAKPSVKMQNKEHQECGTAILVSEDSQSSHDTNMHSKDTISTLKPICSVGSTAQQTVRTPTKLFGKENSQILISSEKPLQTRRNNVKGSIVKITRRKNRILDSEESFQSEHGDEQCNEEDENHPLNEIQQINRSGKKPHQKRRKAFLVTPGSDNCGGASDQEDSSEYDLTEKELNASVKQQNSNTHSLYSCAPDVNMNNISGPVSSTEITSDHDRSSNRKDLSSGESGDLVEDTDELVSNSLKHKLVLPTHTPNVRRTKRMRMKPLEYWRGERVNYKTRPSGGFVVGGIISPEQKELRKPKPRKTKKPVEEIEDMLGDSVVSLKDPSQPVVVFDAESNQEILLECVRSGSSHLVSIFNESVSIYKYLTTPWFSAGKMILKPLKEKGYQYSHTDTLVFHVTQGKLLLTMYDQNYCLTTGDYFFIPPGNVYNVRNLLNKECVILFTQVKGTRPQN
ncbi:centromere protein C [Pogona vitticeps]